MLTQPEDLAEDLLRDALRDGWKFAATSLSYQAVGFGSHHWLAADARRNQFFVTVDDLAAKLRSSTDTTDAAYGRLQHTLAAALSLHRDAGLDFVVAPVPDSAGHTLRRLRDRYSLVVHPYLANCQPSQSGAFDSRVDRLAVVDLLIALHGAKAAPPDADDFTVPLVAELSIAMGQTDEPWDGGPYGRRARDLLAAHAADLAVLLAAYHKLALRVAARPERMVITHGEPHAANVLKTPAGLFIVDWDSALLAPPERDLWALAESDASILAVYSAGSGVGIDRDALSLYRMWFDLAEICSYISLFRGRHGDTADAAQSWQNLRDFLRPADRWPDLPR